MNVHLSILVNLCLFGEICVVVFIGQIILKGTL